MQYELFYLVGERQEAKIDEIKKGVGEILALENATLVGDEVIEKRKLAYEIKHQNKGTYVTRRFELPEVDYWADQANSEKEFGIEAITKKLNLNVDVLRFMIVKTADLPGLGAKEKRQQQEQSTKASGRPEARPAAGQRRPGQDAPRAFQRPMPARPAQAPVSTPVAPAPVAPAAEKAPEPKEAAVVPEKEIIKEKKEKSEAKDIDQQLEELLNI